MIADDERNEDSISALLLGSGSYISCDDSEGDTVVLEKFCAKFGQFYSSEPVRGFPNLGCTQ